MRVGTSLHAYKRKRTGICNAYFSTMSEMKNIDREIEFFSFDRNYYNLDFRNTGGFVCTSNEVDYINLWCYMEKIDIFHSYYEPFVGVSDRVRKILTIHDLIPLINKEWTPLYNLFDIKLRKSAEEADAIIAVSESTKSDVCKYFDVSDKKVFVAYNGNSHNHITNDCVINSRGYKNYLLGVGNLMKYKNFEGMVSAFCIFKKRHPSSPIKLVIVGKPAWQEIEAYHYSIPEHIKEDIVFTGYVTDEELIGLYKSAMAFCHTSFYEGFGLPILEAMSYGKAVISSNTSSMPEVGGDAVEYCNPYDIDSIASAMEKVLLNESYRIELEKKAVIQSLKFSYKKTAEETLKVYREVMR